MSIFQNDDIDANLLNKCDLIDDFPVIMLLNSYYYRLVQHHKSYISLIALLEYRYSRYSSTKPEKIKQDDEMSIALNSKIKQVDEMSIALNNYYNSLVQHHKSYISLITLREYRYSTKPEKMKQDDLPYIAHSAAQYDANLFVSACEINNPLHHYLLDKYPDNFNYIDLAFILSCVEGHFNVAQWLVDIDDRHEYINESCIYTTFHTALKEDKADVLQWLVVLADRFGYNIKQVFNVEPYQFHLMCKYGNLNSAQWCWIYLLPQGSGFDMLESAFIWSCRNGHLHVAKWLMELDRHYQKMNLHYVTISSFIWSCRNGCLDIAKWLLEMGYFQLNEIDVAILNRGNNNHIII